MNMTPIFTHQVLETKRRLPGKLKRMFCSGLILASLQSFGQNAPIIFEAESATFSPTNDVFVTHTEGSTSFVRVEKDLAASSNPGNENHVATYTVTFPVAGTYDLYARIRVGSGNFNDDSYFYGNGFGVKTVTNDNQWIFVNGLASGGFTAGNNTVTGAGSAGSNVWKWLNMSKFTTGSGEQPISFTVTAGNLTQTFQIGGRENGLDFDKFAFGLQGVNFTVTNLDNGEPGSTTPPPQPYTPNHPPLATGKPKFLGNVYSSAQLPNFTAYFNQVTPENAGKWGSVEGQRDAMNWGQLDAAYALAKNNGFPFRFHVLVWGNQQPGWIESLSPEEQLEEIKEWFAAVAERYPALDYIEVVNEPLHDAPRGAGNGNYIEALGGNGATGWDWILNAFRLARQYFPNTKLMINDYSITNSTTSTQRYIEIINLLKAENLIDIIGVQGHAFSTTVPASVTKNNLDLLATTGLPIQVTEMDIDGPDDETHVNNYKRIFPVFWEHPSVMGITLWGYRPGMWRTNERAYLVYENGAERPAMIWLKNYVRNTPPVITPGQVFNISETAANDAAAGTAVATDIDTGNTIQNWRVTGGSGTGLFNIDAATGTIRLTNSSLLDFETTTSYTLTLVVSDGYNDGAEETVTINVVNANDNAPVVAPGQSFAIDGGVCNVLGTITATDADDTNEPGFTELQGWQVVGGTGASIFAIDPSSGALFIADAEAINFNSTSYSLLVQTSDGINTSAPAEVIITIAEKLNICHKGTVISVSKNAAAAHIKHGDCLGACVEAHAGDIKFENENSVDGSAIKVYPNPATDNLYIYLGVYATQTTKIVMADLSGRIVWQGQANGQQIINIPTGQLQTGVYVVNIYGGTVRSFKISKQ